ncbi:hypothetical protein FOXYSP1_04897 [Fusarium oxysporum f. sp. phaseoli]
MNICKYAQLAKKSLRQKHTTAGIRWSSPTQLLIRPLPAYLWESGRDPEFSDRYGRMYSPVCKFKLYRLPRADR